MEKTVFEVWGDGNDATEFDTMEQAIEYANANEKPLIIEFDKYHGCVEEYGQCDICGEWLPLETLGKYYICPRCERAGLDHGF